MRKLLIVTIAAAALLALNTPNVMAIGEPFESAVVEFTNAGAPFPVYQRYFTPDNTKINPNCAATCPTQPCVAFEGQNLCQLTLLGGTTKAPNYGYRGYSEGVENFDPGLPSGTVFHAVFDGEDAAGTGQHKGYYAWTAGAVNDGGTSNWNALDCSGTNAASCWGNANVANSKDVARVPNAPGNVITNIGGLSPIPVPRGTGQAIDSFPLEWDAANSVNRGGAGPGAARYDLYVAKLAPNGGTCTTDPTADQFTAVAGFQDLSGTTATVPFAAAGVGAGEQACVTFALRLQYPDAAGVAIHSRYLSANGQTFAVGGLAADVYDLRARVVGRNNAEISWKTSLEDGLRGFYVQRGFSAEGPFTRVSDLIAAKGEPSTYSYIDTITKVGGKITGLYYKVESVDIDDTSSVYGPVKTDLPKPPVKAIQKRGDKR